MLLLLLSMADQDESEKIEYIYRNFHKDMLYLARSRLRAAGDGNYAVNCEDVVQNAFVKITKYIHAIDFSRSEWKIKTYVMSIVSNEVSNFLRDMKQMEDIDRYADELSDESFLEALHIRQRYDEVVRAIEQLDEKYRLVLLYRFERGMEVAEIAALFGVLEMTVYTRIRRGKTLLLQLLDKMGGTSI
ncbi:MAG: sigma-70 family RNA polymerase sigma factor [Clostridia bacterium]|nr:sigma-70 family RNA polymerase sigma factor [Clostridia bacterium]